MNSNLHQNLPLYRNKMSLGSKKQETLKAPMVEAVEVGYSYTLPKPSLCAKPECVKICTCKKEDFASFKAPKNLPSKDNTIIFRYEQGRITVSGSEIYQIKTWKQLEELGAPKECDLFDSYEDEANSIAYNYFDFQSTLIKEKLKFILIPTTLCLTSVTSKNCANSLASSSFFNSTCHSQSFEIAVSGEVLQDIYVQNRHSYNYTIEGPVIDRLLPRLPYQVLMDFDGILQNQVIANFTPANGSNVNAITYSTSVKKLVKKNQKATVRLTADFYEYKFTLGFMVVVSGEFLLKKTANCDTPSKKININDVKGFKTAFNLSQEVVFMSPGVVTGEYFTSALCKNEQTNLEKLTEIIKKVDGDECKVRPAQQNPKCA